MTETNELLWIEATGNRFLLADGFSAPAPSDPSALAVTIGAEADVDGLLLCLPPESDDGDCRMVVYNMDGSRPEACGNGLLCVARVAVERGHVAGSSVRVETDVGVRQADVRMGDGGSALVRTSLGVPRVEALGERLQVGREALRVHLIQLGNPHCILVTDDIAHAPVDTLGPRLERHRRFPERTNVEFVEETAQGLRVRVWERGVGETAGCGTGAAASAIALVELGRLRAPVLVDMPGGSLRVHLARGEVALEGTVAAPRPWPRGRTVARPRSIQA